MPEPNEPHYSFSPSQRRALGALAVVALLALVLLSVPVGSGLFLGTLLAFSLLRVYDRLCQWIPNRGLAAVLVAVASALAIVGGVALLLYFVIARGIVASTALAHGFDPGGSIRTLMARVEEATRTSPFGPIDLVGRIREAAAAAASTLTSLAGAVAGVTFRLALTFFFTIMTTFFVLRHWTVIVARAERLLPLHPTHTRAVLAEFQKVGREVFVGTMLTGAAQGLLAGIGYAIAGLPEPALLGVLTAICSLLPAVGTLVVWVPSGVALLLSGRVGAGAFVFVWGALVVGVLCDYVIRPRLVGGRKTHVPTLVTFIALFGGVELFGLIGLVVGPVIASVALALLRTYDREACVAAALRAAEPTADEREGPS